MSEDKHYIRLNEAFLYVDDVFLDIVECEKGACRIKHKKAVRIMFSVTAACLCLFMILPAMAMTYNWFGLKDILLPEATEEPISISLHEYRKIPEVQALIEWKEFLAGYYIDKKTQLEAVYEDLSAAIRKDWLLYGVNSFEMGEKLDEITARYGLELHTERNNIEPDIFSTGQFGKESVITEGFIYEDGSFQYKGSTKLNEYGEVSFLFEYIKKGRFCDTLPIIGEKENITEWQYTSAGGETVLLVSGGSESLILADFEGCFVAVTVLDRNGSITKAVLQEFADQIDFGMLKDTAVYKQSQGLRLAEGDKVLLSGLWSSPEARAFAEWNDFLASCDIGVYLESENSVFIVEGREDWSLQAVYSYEMGEKLDEIAGKYGLKLHSEMNVINSEELEYRVGGNFMRDCTKYWGYIYEDGSFSFEGDVDLEECGITDFQFVRSVKGTFGNVMLNIGQVKDYEEWQYLSEGGEPVLLVLGPSKALIFADFEECFISVNILLGSEMGMTKEDMQELANKIDFKLLKDVKVPDMRGDSEIK